jgi:hypothetical protein
VTAQAGAGKEVKAGYTVIMKELQRMCNPPVWHKTCRETAEEELIQVFLKPKSPGVEATKGQPIILRRHREVVSRGTTRRFGATA